MQHEHAQSFSVDEANKTFLNLFPQQLHKQMKNHDPVTQKLLLEPQSFFLGSDWFNDFRSPAEHVVQSSEGSSATGHRLVGESPSSGLPVVILGQVGDERHGHAHIDTCPDGDGQHSQEQGPPGAGACQVEVSFRHRLIGLRAKEVRDKDVRGYDACLWRVSVLHFLEHVEG